MDLLAQLFFLGIVVSTIIETIAILKFLSAFRNFAPQENDNGFYPRTLVILSLRGADSTLPQCLEGLFHQNYSNYEVCIVVNSETDPAWNIVQKSIEEFSPLNARVEKLHTRLPSAGLKNCALIQVLSNLDPSFQVIAQIDSDVIPHRDWLKELVAPLARPKVGATMGNRWYVPVKDSWGALIQYSSNALAVPFMYLNSIPWAGTFALKTHVIREANVLDWLKKSIIEDNVFYQALQSLGLKLKFVPALMMVQKSTPSISAVINFQIRQHLWTRLYHPQWMLSIFVSLAIIIILAGALGLFIFSIIHSSWLPAFYSGLGLSLYFLSTLILISLVEKKIGNILKARGATKEPWFHAVLFLSIPLGLIFNAYSQILALFTRKITWRGVTYLIHGPWQIERLPEADDAIE